MTERNDEARVVVIVNELGTLIKDEGMTARRIERFAPVIMWVLNVTNGGDARRAIIRIFGVSVDNGLYAALRTALGIDNGDRHTLLERWEAYATDHEFGGTPTKTEFRDQVSKAVELLAQRLSLEANRRDSSRAEARSNLDKNIWQQLQ